MGEVRALTVMAMTPVRITVRGAHSVRVRPEPVFQAVAAALAEVRDSLESRHHPGGPVTRYAVDQVRTGSHRPFHPDGEQLPPVYTASVSITATFTDFADLAAWVRWGAQIDGLGIAHVDWALTAASRRKVERKTRRQAIRDARRRAQDYADALDLGPVEVSSISDPGMGGPVQRKVLMAAASAAPAAGPGEFALRPDDVEVAADVEAVFTVRGGA